MVHRILPFLLTALAVACGPGDDPEPPTTNGSTNGDPGAWSPAATIDLGTVRTGDDTRVPTAIELSPDGERLAIAFAPVVQLGAEYEPEQFPIEIYDAASGELQSSIPVERHGAAVQALVWSDVGLHGFSEGATTLLAVAEDLQSIAGATELGDDCALGDAHTLDVSSGILLTTLLRQRLCRIDLGEGAVTHAVDVEEIDADAARLDLVDLRPSGDEALVTVIREGGDPEVATAGITIDPSTLEASGTFDASNDEYLLAALEDGYVVQRDATELRISTTSEVIPYWSAMANVDKTDLVVFANDDGLRVYSLPDGALTGEIAERGSPETVAISVDGSRIAMYDEASETALIFDL